MQKAISKALLSLAYLDIDECSTGTHSCSTDAECNNIKGSHNCQCKSGYSGNGHTCTGNPMEYCMLDLQPNGLLYANIYLISIFESDMLLILKKNHWWFAYSDSDECLTGTHNCSADAVCNNTKGSHNCTCKPGYSGNGQICEGNIGCFFPFRCECFLH